MNQTTTASLCLFAVLLPLIQSRPARPEFEVATVKINNSRSLDSTGDVTNGRVTLRNQTLKLLVSLAYKVRPNMIQGAPGWFDSDRFDVVAKASPNTSDNNIRLMLQSLFESQFKLTVHREEKELEGYALLPAKTGVKLPSKDTKPRDEEGCNQGAGGNVVGEHHFACYMSMEKLAEALPVLAPGWIDRPVVDQTGLEGFYRFKLDWAGAVKIYEVTGGTMFDALKSVGLQLQGTKVRLLFVVIDHIERIPSGS